MLSRPDAAALEFVLIAPESNPRHVEIVTMTAHYNHGIALDEGHTVPIGDLWLPGSRCDHVLLRRPLAFGERFGHIDDPAGAARILWLVPITAAERDFKAANGLAALASRLDEAAVEYWRPDRASIV